MTPKRIILVRHVDADVLLHVVRPGNAARRQVRHAMSMKRFTNTKQERKKK